MSSITQLNSVPGELTGVTAVPASPTSTGSSSSASSSSSRPAASGDGASSPPQQAASAQRLVIQAGAQSGVFIYTILDRATGRVLVQIPREEVIQLARRPDYSAGAVIDTKA